MILGADIGRLHIKITSLTHVDGHIKVKSRYSPFSGKAKIIEPLVSFVSHPDLVIITQTLYASRQLLSSAKEGTHSIIDVTENLFGENVRYVGLSYKLYTPA